MNRHWLKTIFVLTFLMLSVLKAHELKSLRPFFRAEPAIKIQKFTEVKSKLGAKDQELLELWESVLTGRSAPLAKVMKETYQDLGLKHVFTPSGFHLSAVLTPFLKISSSTKYQLLLLSIIGALLFTLPGFGALKRMVIIKGFQRISGLKYGFAIALIFDILSGSFQHAPLSFTYSFLFLGIIYSGATGVGLIFWFFLGQLVLAYFQGTQISPLLLLWCPILNMAFALAMPLLFLLAIPLCNWQLKAGLFILEWIQRLVVFASETLSYIPLWEIHAGVILLFYLMMVRRFKQSAIVLLFLCNSLGIDTQKIPPAATYEFRPQGRFLKSRGDIYFFEDGKCKRNLIKGHWWEKCSPIKRSTRIKLS